MNKKYNKYIYCILFVVLTAIIGIYIMNKKELNSLFFKMNGDSEINLYLNEIYEDHGVSVIKNGVDISDKVVTNSNLNTTKSGQYYIKYTLKHGLAIKTIIRTINVVDIARESFYITLNGSSNVYLPNGCEYEELGATAFDIIDGDISSKIVIDGAVNANIDGQYEITYLVINSKNIQRTIIRKVIVYSLNVDLQLQDVNIVKDGTFIVLNTSDKLYYYTVTPNGYKNVNNNFSYYITQNGTYEFKIYDLYGNSMVKMIEVHNIDTELPTGTCTGTMYDSYTDLVVDAYDDLGISGYIYKYGSNKTVKLTSNTYRYTELINEATVIVYDMAGNTTNVVCEMNDKSQSTSSGYMALSFKNPDGNRVMQYWLYIPKNVSIRNKAPLLIYLHGDGSRGSDVNLVTNYAFPKFIKEGTDYPFMMIAPQINNETNWTSENTIELLMKLVNYITSTYNVDTDRIMLSGGSSGGGGGYVITAKYPHLFSCTVIGSGMYDSSYRKIANNLIYTPMWIFHGMEDTHISYSSVKSLAEYINSLGGKVKFIGVAGAGHGVTDTVDGFRNPELISWMIEQRASNNY